MVDLSFTCSKSTRKYLLNCKFMTSNRHFDTFRAMKSPKSRPTSPRRLCAIEALMQFGAAAKKHSTSIMSVLEDDVYLVRLLLGMR